MTAAINAIAGFLFIGGLVLATVITSSRVIYYSLNNRRMPRLLRRDLAVMGGLALSFALIVAARALGLSEEFRASPVWALVTDIPAVTAVLVYLYYEIFVIERGR